MIPGPQGLNLQQWADAVVLTTATAWPLGRLDDVERWQEWAVGLVRAPDFAKRVLPDPYQFSDWREWATRTVPMLEGAG